MSFIYWNVQTVLLGIMPGHSCKRSYFLGKYKLIILNININNKQPFYYKTLRFVLFSEKVITVGSTLKHVKQKANVVRQIILY